jgi:TolA-binding protein
MFRRTGIAILAAAFSLAAADKPSLDTQMKEMQRDVAQLQEMVKNMQAAFDQKFAAVSAQVQGIGTAVERANASLAALAATVQKGLEPVGPAIAAQGGRIDKAGEALATMQQAMADLNASLSKMQTQLGDLNNAVKVLAAPPVAPPGSEKPAAADLINNAQGDQSGGKSELALQEYSDYLKWYGDTPMAHVAQFQVGYLHYQSKDYDAALADFDALAQKFPTSTHVPDSLLLKRRILQAQGKNAEAASVCQELRQRFAGSEQAKQCAPARR